MFARVTAVDVKLEKREEAKKIYIDNVLPVVKAQKGYKSIILMGNPRTGKSMAITMWDSEEDSIANEKSGYFLDQMKKFRHIFTSQPLMFCMWFVCIMFLKRICLLACHIFTPMECNAWYPLD